ncbi:MAG: chloride channel protein, partial [Acidimicrobiales bacterium]
PPAPDAASNPLDLLRSRSYVVLLLFGALIGIPVALVAYYFLKIVDECQGWVFQTLPVDLGFDAPPAWWPLPVLVVAGLVVALVIEHLPGTGGESPAEGFHSGGAPPGIDLPGIFVAAFATLGLGAVLGPEAPLIAIGSGLAVLAVHLVKKDAPAQASVVIGAAGSFAAISTLLGSPIIGAFLLMEVAGLGGPLLGVVLVPGLLASAVGSLVFIGLNSLTGYGTFSLAIPNIPAFATPNGFEFLWAIAIGLMAAVLGSGIRRGARLLEPVVARRRVWLTPVVGAAIALAAIVFHQVTDRGIDQVLFSGENTMAPLIQNADSWTAGALALLVACKSLAYGLSMSSFRGGPTFPAMFIGTAGGLALSHFSTLPPIAGVAMGIGAMAVTMLGLPLTSVMLTAIFLEADQLTLMPLIIVAVVVAYVASARLAPAVTPGTEPVAPATT